MPDCINYPSARGLCAFHYRRAHHKGELPETWEVVKDPYRWKKPGVHALTNVDLDNMIADCAVCGTGVPIVKPTGHTRQCLKARQESRKKVPSRSRRDEWPSSRPEAERNYRYLREYGISLADYQRMYEAAGGKCEICKKPQDVLRIDHDHGTAVVRGLLCNRCNLALGQLEDSPQRARSLVKYLERTNGMIF